MPRNGSKQKNNADTGEVAEWFNAAVLKTVEDASPPRVRISASPPIVVQKALLMQGFFVVSTELNQPLHFANNKQTKAGIYNQLELFFNNGKTSRINLSYRFHSDNWKKEETKEYRRQGILSKLQKQIEIKNYKNQNKMGASTAYKIMKIYKDDINEEKTEEIKKAIEKFIKKIRHNLTCCHA